MAASRAAERDSQRRQRAFQRGHDQIDRIVDRLESEIERDLEKIRKIEARILANPISASGMRYNEQDRRWSLKELADNTGNIKWSLDVNFGADAIASDTSITNGGRIYDLIAAAATRWAVFVAVRVTAASNGRPTKLFNKRDSTANKVILKSGGVLYRALEGQLDIELPIPGSDVAIVAFPLPKGQAADVAIEFLLKNGTSRMPLRVENASLFAEALTSKTLVEQAREKFEAQTAPVKAQATEVKADLVKKANTGSGMFWVVVIVLIVVVMVVASS
jgi:hypothetical protein